MMKKLISITLLLILTSCTAPQEASTIGSDAAVYNMNTVKDYNSRIISGNTVSTQEKIKVAQKRVPQMRSMQVIIVQRM